jgi:predicted RNase H-like nuclease (RuvC/YqgF family)
MNTCKRCGLLETEKPSDYYCSLCHSQAPAKPPIKAVISVLEAECRRLENKRADLAREIEAKRREIECLRGVQERMAKC